MYEDFLAGCPPEDPSRYDWFRSWLDTVERSAAAFTRIRILDEPPTDYQRFAAWALQWNAQAGEDIHHLSRSAAQTAQIPDGDWWMFDDTTVVRIIFDDITDGLAHYELAPADQIGAFRAVRDRVLTLAADAEVSEAV